jgi:hypothetical protein
VNRDDAIKGPSFLLSGTRRGNERFFSPFHYKGEEKVVNVISLLITVFRHLVSTCGIRCFLLISLYRSSTARLFEAVEGPGHLLVVGP